MTTRLAKLAAAAEGRYFTADERQQLLGFAAALPERLRHADAVEPKEDAVLRATIEELRGRYPNFHRFHDQAWAKCYRDLQLILRFDVQAMVLDDATWLDDRVLLWLRSILASCNFTPKFVRDTYEALRDQARKLLPADAYEALRPYLQRNVDVLSDIPEPATPAV